MGMHASIACVAYRNPRMAASEVFSQGSDRQHLAVRRRTIGWLNRVPSWLVRQTHDKCQSDVQAQNVLVVEMADLSSNSLAPNGDRLIGHHLRSHSQPIF